MKISKLYIDSFRHLENLEFDFTYPNDFHDEAKRGKPLDKICFIGQSATGKTGLLELIYDTIEYLNSLEVANNRYVFDDKDQPKPFEGNLVLNFKNEVLNYSNNAISFNNFDYSFGFENGEISKLITNSFKKNLYYFKSNLISETNIHLFSSNPLDLLEKYSSLILDIKKIIKLNNSIQKANIIFDSNVESNTWIFMLLEILDYRKKFNQKMSELIHKGLLANQNKLQTEFNLWQKENPNTLELFAQKFNPILEKLNLEVDIVNTEYSIPIKNKKNDEVIPIQNTSTGTKGLLLSFLPLFKLDTKDSIILIDEPERSLYPDMQMDLMEYYQNLAPEAQFIVATHSPFVAASFEPDERFILYFDEKGKVAVRRGNSPIGDDPNDMLKNDFGINYYNKYGEAAYKKYIQLKEKVAKEEDPKKKKELLLETVKLGDTYNF